MSKASLNTARIHSWWWGKQVHNFSKGTSLKMNVMVRLNFKHTYSQNALQTLYHGDSYGQKTFIPQHPMNRNFLVNKIVGNIVFNLVMTSTIKDSVDLITSLVVYIFLEIFPKGFCFEAP